MLAKGKMNCKTARMIDIVDFLVNLGYLPAKVNEREAWFLSPLKANEIIPSFNVDRQKQLWYDFGFGEGGDIIALGCKMFNCSVSEFLVKIQHQKFSFSQQNYFDVSRRKIIVNSICELKEIALIDYLRIRCIEPELAKGFCKQIEYTVGNNYYRSIGFANIAGGWKLRSKSFKGATSKAISIISHYSTLVCVFEGFFDLLSFVQLNRETYKNFDLISLNSLALLGKLLNHLQRYCEINFFLDNDERGMEGACHLSQVFGSRVVDRSILYAGYKDLNEYLIAKRGGGKGVTAR